jgi:hypothetical protein
LAKETVKKGNGSKISNNDSGLNFEAQLWAAADKMRGPKPAENNGSTGSWQTAFAVGNISLLAGAAG